MKSFSDKISFLTTYGISVKFLLALADFLKRFGTWHGHAPVKNNLTSLTKHNTSFMLLPAILKLRNSLARKGNEDLTLIKRAYPNPINNRQLKLSIIFQYFYEQTSKRAIKHDLKDKSIEILFFFLV